MESPPDKVVLVGDVGVGKTTLFMRFRTGEFVENTAHNPRLGEFHKSWNKGSDKVSLTLFDTAGIERHMSTIPPTYFRWSKVIMLVYSLDDSDTFDSLTNWADNAIGARAGRSQSDVITVLVGNKLDLEDDRQVSPARARQYAENNDISEDMIFEVSALDGSGVQEMFDAVAVRVKPEGERKKPTNTNTKKGACCA
uniref:Rab-like6 n=1 Tax=Suberites domuncula TaxID=55567 RepID=A1XKT9_SUBDO|nr:Rab-like6 [Suberites domuncula]